MIVLDASAALELVLGGRRGRAVEARLREAGPELRAPALIDPEVAHALRRAVSLGRLPEPHARAALALFGELPLRRHVVTRLLPRIWTLRENLTAYDAAYVALAEALACPLLTFDARIAEAAGHTAGVVVP